MTPASRKQKGSRLERIWATRLRESGLDEHARRMPTSGAVQDMKSDIYTTLPFQFELKNQETWSPDKYMKQAIDGKKQHEMPVVVMSKNNMSDPYVMMLASDWIWLCQLAKESGSLVGRYGYQKADQLRKGK